VFKQHVLIAAALTAASAIAQVSQPAPNGEPANLMLAKERMKAAGFAISTTSIEISQDTSTGYDPFVQTAHFAERDR
jgi:hypothetical protein